MEEGMGGGDCRRGRGGREEALIPELLRFRVLKDGAVLKLLHYIYILKISKMNFTGLIIGVAAFLMIGVFHPIVIKAEYHFGTKCWWAFLLAGLCGSAASLLTSHYILSTLLGVFAFSCFWSILEVFQQKKRVERGWFPANPKRKR